MAENIIKLKKRAVDAGMPKDEAMKAGREKLETFLKSAKKSSGKKAETKATKKVVAKKKTGKKAGTKKAAGKKSSKKAPAKAKPAAKKSNKAKVSKSKKSSDAESGRLTIGSINWKAESDEWNPKKGGPVERLFKALKKANGNVDKAYDAIKDKPYDFVGRKKRNGEKRSKAEVEKMLRYRLNRTKYEFAVRTGQHDPATNRVEYGKGQYAQPKKSSKKSGVKSGTKKKASSKKSTSKKGKKAGTKKSKRK